MDWLRLKRMKSICSTQGWTVVIYNVILTFTVMLFADLADAKGLPELYGWGYFLAIVIGLVILLLWKKKDYFSDTICQNAKPMNLGSFAMLFAIFISVQAAFQILSILIELWLNAMGLSIVNGIASATEEADTFSMFLYASIGAPISEEILFRGCILRSFEPMGKKFAIFASALLFGLFHGNIIQIPFAFLIGLVLAYVTFEHNIWWAMLLHMFNNMILGDTFYRVLPADAASLVVVAVIYGCTIASCIILAVKRNAIKAYLQSHRNDPLAYRAFFANPGVITFLIYIGIDIVLTTLLLLSPYGY